MPVIAGPVECAMEDVIPKRERRFDGDVNVMSAHPNRQLDYLTLYTPKGIVICRSIGHGPQDDITVRYRGILFIASPGIGIESVIVVEWNSLIEYMNNNGEYD